MSLVWYVSSHGFGHAVRDVEVLNEIGRCQPDLKIILRGSVPAWFLQSSLRVAVDIQAANVDTGVVQIDSLHIDEEQTAQVAAVFYRGFAGRVEAEADVLRTSACEVVVGDIPPVAFAAAERAGIPSVALGNFTWDWIYGAYPQFDQIAPDVVPTIGTAYSSAALALRLPMHGGFDTMTEVVEDIPHIARRSAQGRQTARTLLGVGAAETIVLASFGGLGLTLDYERIARANPFRLIVTQQESAQAATAPNLIRLSRQEMSQRGLRYEDLVAASDVVVSKPGYGIVSECIANGAALLYTSRGRFAEQDVFIREMPEALRCRALPQEDLLSGRWRDAVSALLAQDAPARTPSTDGAAVAAAAILRLRSDPTRYTWPRARHTNDPETR
jgi:L-arabinokinase